MKPHLEERNQRLYDEYHRRVCHEIPADIIKDIAAKEHLSENTTRVICGTRNYGTYGSKNRLILKLRSSLT
jgi:hypothetical protein